jgi:cytochrome c-type biogenesis protein CcmH/NrfF
MIRDDDSHISLRELSRWMLPAVIVLLGLILFFLMVRKTETTATPVPVELPRI